MPMQPLMVHVRGDNRATLTCPACGCVKHFSAEPYRHGRHTMTVRCSCRETFPILLNFRRHFRKPTDLPGTYTVIGGGGGIIQVNNLSRSGAGFTVSGVHRIEKGQEILIEFQLNDKKKTVLKKQAVVRSVRQNAIGCEFKDTGEMDKALGFFLQD
ncbi:PilZ domain-containing protein [Desulfobulbus elongatus]|uniref:PilZ domain-containing protein n=1 Tax=Desulfobulbus elongatus TaxID=53332 RepID=UPI00047F4DB8|nr:PilZ domain-containing protein [Desulfobulbus elongatus]